MAMRSPTGVKPSINIFRAFEKVEVSESTWTITLSGLGEIKLPAHEVLDQTTFIRRCFEKFGYAFQRQHPDDWCEILNSASRNAHRKQETE
jgi:hypothetical protein